MPLLLVVLLCVVRFASVLKLVPGVLQFVEFLIIGVQPGIELLNLAEIALLDILYLGIEKLIGYLQILLVLLFDPYEAQFLFVMRRMLMLTLLSFLQDLQQSHVLFLQALILLPQLALSPGNILDLYFFIPQGLFQFSYLSLENNVFSVLAHILAFFNNFQQILILNLEFFYIIVQFCYDLLIFPRRLFLHDYVGIVIVSLYEIYYLLQLPYRLLLRPNYLLVLGLTIVLLPNC